MFKQAGMFKILEVLADGQRRAVSVSADLDPALFSGSIRFSS